MPDWLQATLVILGVAAPGLVIAVAAFLYAPGGWSDYKRHRVNADGSVTVYTPPKP